MQLDKAIDYFLTAKRVENRSTDTIATYATALGMFAKMEPEVGEVEDINAFVVRHYIGLLQAKPDYKAVSVANRVRHLRAFCQWLVDEELLRATPFGKKVRVPDFARVGFTPITDAEFRSLLSLCDTTTVIGRRDYALLMFLMDTGVRVSEACDLRVDNLNLKGRLAKVVGKGRKERTVPISVQTAIALQRHLTKRRGRGADSEYVFNGQKFGYEGRWDRSGVEQRLRKACVRAGLRNLNPHLFRHTFATNMIAAGMDPATLQAILGHADVSTTIKNYVHLNTGILSDKHDQFSQMARLVGRR